MQDIVLDSKSESYQKSSNKFVFSFIRTVLLSLILGALISLDFVLYLRSGSVFVLKDNFNLPVLYVIGFIFAFSFGLMLLSCLFKRIQKFLFVVVVCSLAWGFLSQFLQIDKSQYLSILLSSLLGMNMLLSYIEGYSHWILLILIFVLTYSFLNRSGNKTLSYISGILLLMLAGVTGTTMINSPAQPMINQIYVSQNNNFPDNHKKTIFLFMPNLMSSYVLPSSNDGKDPDNSQKHKNIMLGFLQKYGFNIYLNAYISNDLREVNLVESLNALDGKSYQNYIMNNVGLEKLWKFRNAQKTDIYLKNNQLINVFQKAHFKVNAYQNQKIEICKQNNQFNVDRCYNRSSQPFDISAFGFDDTTRAEILFYQWLHSLDIFTRSDIADIIQIFIDRSTALKMALPYEQMYVVNSFDVLKQVLQDVADDKNTASAYFIALDFPNNLFVFNEQCLLKPYQQWTTDNFKFKVAGSGVNLKNYNNQMICFWKQMDDFMQNLQALDPEQNLTFVIQGISNGGESGAMSVSFIDKFKKHNTVFLAIRDHQAHFGIYNEFCQAKDIIRNYLFKSPRCVEFKGVSYSESAQSSIKNQLQELFLTQSDINNAAKFYAKEMEEWKVQHQPLFGVQKNDNQEEKSVNIGDILSDEAAKVLNNDNSTEGDNENAFAKTLEAVENIKIDDVPLERASETKADDKKAATQTPSQVVEPAPQVQAVQPELTTEQPVQTAPVVEPTPSQVVEPAPQVQAVQPEPTTEQPVQTAPVVEPTPSQVVEPAPQVQAVQPELTTEQSVQTAPVVEPTPSQVVEPAPQVQAVQPEPTTEQSVQTAPVVEPTPSQVVESAPQVQAVQPEPTTEQPVQTAPTTTQQAIETQQPVVVRTIHYETPATTVSGDFLLQEPQQEWEFDPAQALGVSGEPQEHIIVKVK
ncbi:MAG: hypothetical protein IJ545_03265 [Alphaproteobacteria bacterium]|nr:hypothetical protein [Alphaproteobacteria bacterium]